MELPAQRGLRGSRRARVHGATSPSTPNWRPRRTRAPNAAQYGRYGSLADLLRQIGHDERTHKQGSLINMRTPRFAS